MGQHRDERLAVAGKTKQQKVNQERELAVIHHEEGQKSPLSLSPH